MAQSNWQGNGTRVSFGTGVTSVTPAITTTNLTPGDIVFIHVGVRSNEDHVGSDPAWTKLDQTNITTQWSNSLWAIIVPDEGFVPELTVSWLTSNNGGFAQSWSIGREPNGDTLAEAMNFTVASGSSGTFFIAGRPTTRDNSYGLLIGSCQGTGTFTPPTGWTERIDAGSSTGTSRNFVDTKPAGAAGTMLEDYTLSRVGAWVLYLFEILEAVYDNTPIGMLNSGDGYMDASNVVNVTSNPILAGNGNRALFRFAGVNVPAGKYLKRARLRISLSVAATAYQDFGYIWGDKVANAPLWTVEAPNLARLTSASTPIYFEVQAPATTLASGNPIFLDVTEVLKEVRRTPGWAEGNAVRFVQDYGTSAAALSIAASEGGGTSTPQLILDYGDVTNTVSFVANSAGSFEGWWDPYTGNAISDPNIGGFDLLRIGTSNSGIIDMVVYGDRQAALTGSSLTVNGQTYTLAGQSYDGTMTTASYNRSGATELVVGQSYTITLNMAGGNNLNLPAATGVFTRTGRAANLLRGWTLPAAGRAFTLASPATGLRKGLPFPLASATFIHTPSAANLLFQRKLVAAQRAFTVTGINAVTAASRRLTATSGSLSLTSAPTALRHGYVIPANTATFALASAPNTMRRSRAVAATPGTYIVAAPTTNLLRTRQLVAAPAAFTSTYVAATLRKTTGGFSAAPGAFSFTSPAAFIRRGFQLPAQPGALSLTGNAVAVRHSLALPAAPATYAAVFRDAILLRNRALRADPGHFLASAPDTRLGQFFRKAAAVGSFLLNPQAALLALKRQLVADAAAFDLTGAADLNLSGPITITPPSARIYTPFFEDRVIVFPAEKPRIYAPPADESRVLVFPTENRIMLAPRQLFEDRVITP